MHHRIVSILLSALSIASLVVASENPLKIVKRQNDGPEAIDLCKFPVIAGATIPKNPSTGKAYYAPNEMIWEALKMKEWINALVKDCPALTTSKCNGASCQFPYALGRLIIGPEAHVTCTSSACSWDPVSKKSAFRGPILGPSGNPPLPLDATEEQILAYRRWLTLRAMKNVAEYFNQVKTQLVSGFLSSIGGIGEIVDTFAPELVKKNADVDEFDLLGFASTILSFMPYGPIFSTGINVVRFGIDYAKQTIEAADKLHGADARDALEIGVTYASTILKTATRQMNARQKKDIKFSSKILAKTAAVAKGLPKTKVATNPAKPKELVKLHNVQSYYSKLFNQFQLEIATAATNALARDPLADEGFVSMVEDGWFSEQTSTTDLDAYEAGQQFARYLRDRVLSMVFKTVQLWFYKNTYKSKAECLANVPPRWNIGDQPDVCFPTTGSTNGQYDLILPAVYDNFVDENGKNIGMLYKNGKYQYQQHYTKFTDKNLKAYNLTYQSIAESSRRCFSHENTKFLATDNMPVCDFRTGKGITPSTPLQLWSSPVQDESMAFVPAQNETCYWSIPFMDVDAKAFMSICENQSDYFGSEYWDQNLYHRIGRIRGFFGSGPVFGRRKTCDFYRGGHGNTAFGVGLLDYPAQRMARRLFYPKPNDQVQSNECNVACSNHKNDGDIYFCQDWRKAPGFIHSYTKP